MLFEWQAKKFCMDPKHWAPCLLALLTSDHIQVLTREAEEKFEYNDYIKNILLKQFKLRPEKFRKKFMDPSETSNDHGENLCLN